MQASDGPSGVDASRAVGLGMASGVSGTVDATGVAGSSVVVSTSGVSDPTVVEEPPVQLVSRTQSVVRIASMRQVSRERRRTTDIRAEARQPKAQTGRTNGRIGRWLGFVPQVNLTALVHRLPLRRACHQRRLASSCGGGSDDTASTGDADAAPTTIAATPIREATPTVIVIPTATSLPTPTPLPTSTPVPLDSPTPSAILLGSAFTNDSKVTTVGIDEVFFGMSADQAAEAASTDWLGEPSGSSPCYKVAPAAGPNGVELWIVSGFVERVDVEHPDIRTPSKLGVGNTLTELQGQLGDRLTSETADDGTVVATFTPSDAGDREFRLIFELADDAVVRYRSGRVGVVDQPAGDCHSSINSTE